MDIRVALLTFVAVSISFTSYQIGSYLAYKKIREQVSKLQNAKSTTPKATPKASLASNSKAKHLKIIK